MPERFRTDDAPEPRVYTSPPQTALPPRPLETPRLEDSYEEGAENDRLTGAARTIGHAAGTAIHHVGRVVEQTRDLPQSMRERFTVIKGRGPSGGVSERATQAAQDLRESTTRTLEETGERVSRMAQQMGDRATELADEIGDRTASTIRQVGDRAADVGRRAQQQAEDAAERARRGVGRVRARLAQTADEQPQMIVLASAGAAFIAGFLLRIAKGRSRHD